MLQRRRQRGQSTAEYAVLIAIVVAAIVGMQTFVKRGLQARYQSATEALTNISTEGGALVSLNTKSQYEPYYAAQDIATARSDNFNETYNDGAVGRTGILSQATRTGSQEEQASDQLGSDDGWQ